MQSAFYISDGTAITSEAFGHALLSHFPCNFDHITLPFVETEEQAYDAKTQINECYAKSGLRPLVFHTFVNPTIADIISSSEGLNHNFLQHFIKPLEKQLDIKAKPVAHRTHSIHENSYDFRMDAVNYALKNDDGGNVADYDTADIILVGVSRSGKTPTSLYLALQYGIKAANYPFTEEDMDNMKIPSFLLPFKHKMFGLTIKPERLSQIRSERMANSRYSSLRQCRLEIQEVEVMYKRQRIPFIDSTRYSIEEISAKVLVETGLKRHHY